MTSSTQTLGLNLTQISTVLHRPGYLSYSVQSPLIEMTCHSFTRMIVGSILWSTRPNRGTAWCMGTTMSSPIFRDSQMFRCNTVDIWWKH